MIKILIKKMLYIAIMLSSELIAMEKPSKTYEYKGIKIGLELELQTIEYVPVKDERGLRHKRLLEVFDKESERLIWYIEVDSSNRHLEIVTLPLKLPEENALFDVLKKSIKDFLMGINSEAKKSGILGAPEVEASLKLIVDNITSQKADNFKSLKIGDINPEIKIKRHILPAISIKPQVTFQLPLVKIARIFNFLKENTFSNHIFFKDTIFPETLSEPEDGLFLLFKYYTSFLSNERSSLYHHDKYNTKEIGVKSGLPIMSRLSFFKMYHHGLNLSPKKTENEALTKEQQNFNILVNSLPYEIKHKKLFGGHYAIMKNKLRSEDLIPEIKSTFMAGQTLSNLLSQEKITSNAIDESTTRNWTTAICDDDISKITIQDFIQSIKVGRNIFNLIESKVIAKKSRKNESDSPLEKCKKYIKSRVLNFDKQKNILKQRRNLFLDLYKQKKIFNKKNKESLNTNYQKEYQEYRRIFNTIFSDLISPPPYTKETDSMNSLEFPEDYKNYGEAIIEIRSPLTEKSNYFPNEIEKFFNIIDDLSKKLI